MVAVLGFISSVYFVSISRPFYHPEFASEMQKLANTDLSNFTINSRKIGDVLGNLEPSDEYIFFQCDDGRTYTYTNGEPWYYYENADDFSVYACEEYISAAIMRMYNTYNSDVDDLELMYDGVLIKDLSHYDFEEIKKVFGENYIIINKPMGWGSDELYYRDQVNKIELMITDSNDVNIEKKEITKYEADIHTTDYFLGFPGDMRIIDRIRQGDPFSAADHILTPLYFAFLLLPLVANYILKTKQVKIICICFYGFYALYAVFWILLAVFVGP